MGGGQSTYTGPSGLDVADREGGDGSPEVFMIEPVPEGLEHVVYPKYEEAFRLGLEALTNPMRVNKFYRPLPHILGSIEFQKHSHAGIIPVAKPAGSSGMPTPRQTPFRRPPQVSGSMAYEAERHAPSASEDENYEECREETREVVGDDWRTVKQAVTLEFSSAHRSYADFDAVHGADLKTSSKESAASEADAEAYRRAANLESVSSAQALDGGLFDADEAMSSALETYRRMHGTARSKRSVSRSSSRRSQLAGIPGERSQVSKDLEQLGRSISDLHQGRVSPVRSQLTKVAERSRVREGLERLSKSIDELRRDVSPSESPRSLTGRSHVEEDLEQLNTSIDELQGDITLSQSDRRSVDNSQAKNDMEKLSKSIDEVQRNVSPSQSQKSSAEGSHVIEYLDELDCTDEDLFKHRPRSCPIPSAGSPSERSHLSEHVEQHDDSGVHLQSGQGDPSASQQMINQDGRSIVGRDPQELGKQIEEVWQEWQARMT